MSFVHIDVAMNHSIKKDNLIFLERLIEQAKKRNTQAIGVAEFKTMHSAFDFYSKCTKEAIKPLIGLKASLCDNEVEVTLIAKSYKGYQTLLKLSSEMNGMIAGKNHLQFEDIKGEIIVVVHLDGLFEKEEMEKMKEVVQKLLKLNLKEDLYFSLSDHGFEYQKKKNAWLRRQRKKYENNPKYKIQLTVTNNVKYHEKSQSKAQHMWSSLNNIRKGLSHEQYLKTYEEMKELFTEEELQTTVEIAEKCQVHIPHKKAGDKVDSKLPNVKITKEFKIPKNLWKMFDYDEKEYTPPQNKVENMQIAFLVGQAYWGLLKKYGSDLNNPQTKLAYEKLRYELGVVIALDRTKYFLQVQKFVGYAKSAGILTGPGRGSAPGSILAYCLDITEICPIEYDLVFERFLHKYRKGDPDIDIDFSGVRKDEVYRYAIEEYGKDHVAKILTHNTYGASNAMRDVAKKMNEGFKKEGKELFKKDLLLKLKKFILDTTVIDMKNASLIKMMESDKRIADLIYFTNELCPLINTSSIHPSGVIISETPIHHDIPVMLKKEKSGEEVFVTQYVDDEGQIDDLGLTKIDFLNSHMLDVIGDTKEEAKINIIPLDDPKTFDMIQRGEVIGGFQLDSSKMQQTAKQIKPQNIKELNDVISIYRPGPVEGIPNYVAEKFGREIPNKEYGIVRNHPDLKPIFDQTWGVIIYQEQVMNLIKIWADYPLSDTDKFRQLIKKKDNEGFEKEIVLFKEKSSSLGREKGVTELLIELIVKFANYGYNLSHGASYAHITYESLYLKANYPQLYFKNLLNKCANDKKMKEKIQLYLEEVKKIMTLKKPSVNTSNIYFEINGDSLEFGLMLIKNVGKGDVQKIIKGRENGPYLSIQDFMNRTTGLKLSTTVLSLAKAGALDCLGNRKEIIEFIQNPKHNEIENIPSLYLVEGYSKDIKTNQDYTSQQLKMMEEEVMGTSFVKTRYEQNYTNMHFIEMYNEDSIKRTFVEVVQIREHETQAKKEKMAFMTIRIGKDIFDDVKCFPRQWSKYQIEEGKCYLIDLREKDNQLIVNDVQEVKDIEMLLIINENLYKKIPKTENLHEKVYVLGLYTTKTKKVKFVDEEVYKKATRESENNKTINIRL